MNEQLKIIITASTSAAKKAIKEVREEIEKTSQSAKKNGKSISDSMKAVAKGAAIAVGAIAAITGALVAFGKSTIEAQKNISKLNAAFLASGSSTKQAGETYKNLYRFMGDSGAATEAAQQLALITTNTEDLAEWTKILQGVYATMGSTLPIESLAEAANETINVGKVTSSMADALNWVGISEDAFNEQLAQTASIEEREVLVRSTLNALYSNAANIYERNNHALLAYNQSQAQVDLALARAGRAIMPLMTALNNLAATLLTVLRPAFEVVAGIIAIFVEWIMVAVSWVSAFFSLFSGKGSGATKEVSENIKDTGKNVKNLYGGLGGISSGLNKAASAAKELKKQTMGFDELNVVSSQDAGSSGAGASGGAGGGGVPMPDLSSLTDFELPGLEEFEKSVDSVKEKIKSILILVGLIGGAILGAWLYLEYWPGSMQKFLAALKLSDADMALLHNKIKNFTSTLMIIAGAILLIQGYSDAWVNGIDWGNLAAMLGGVALVVGGIALSFGALYAGAAAIGAGIALVVVGIKDFITNGYSMEAVLTILAGVIAVVVGVCLAFNAALLANPITWVVIAIAALVAAFVILWNECEGFRNFFIALWEGIKKIVDVVVDWVVNAFNVVVAFFKENWQALLLLLVNPFAGAFKLLYDNCDGFRAFIDEWVQKIGKFFQNLWTGIKDTFSNVKEWFSEKFSAAWEAIKFIWDAVIGYFSAIWESIALVFSVVKAVLSGNWQEAWDGIKAIVDVWGSYFSGIWEGIKTVFSSVKTWFSNTFSAAWQAVKDVFAGWGTFFSGLWETIKTTFSKLGSSIGSAIGDAVKSGINGIITMIENTINKAINLINGAIDLINKLPGVSVSKLTRLTMPRLAKGGIVDTATVAMIGEAGKEAVIPLENNTEWMDKLAERLAEKNSAPSKIVLMLDGKELGWANIHSINDITKQTGTLPLVLA